ncbi:MAG: DUF1351 domain-containing protein [Lachnospiraceae bacterium]|nr:DUF1351 domain-containing protein [Lachnospiraceae bacterium]
MALELKIVSPSEEGFVKEIVWNADEIATEVEAKVGYYKNLVYTEDQVTEAKKDRAQLNKFIAALKAKDKEIKALCLAPYEVFHKRMLQIIAKVEEPANLIDTHVKGFEEEQKNRKYEAIADVFGQKGFHPWLTLDRMMEKFEICGKWLNKSYSMKQIECDMTSIQHRIGDDILAINNLGAGRQMALSEYKRSMDLARAIEQGQKYEEARKAEEALKQAMAAQPEPQKEALEDVRLFGEEPVQPAPAPNPMERREKFFKVFVTREELQALNHFLISNGYTFREIKNQ